MTDLQPLTVLLEQNERQRDAAIADHQRAVTAAEAAQQQTEQLRTYRSEYEQRWSAQFRVQGQIELVHCYQNFTERLTLAIEQQTHVAARAAQQVERAMAALRESEMRCASVRKLIERRVHEMRVATDRREQKQSDEFASRAAWSNRMGANGGPRFM